MEYKLDKKAYKVLKIIYKNSPISKDMLFKKTKLKDTKEFDHILVVLKPFAANPRIRTKTDGFAVYDRNIITVNDDGKVYVENYTRENIRFRIPITISITALIISFISLLYSILK